MFQTLLQIILLPFELAVLLIGLLGRTLALIIGLMVFSVGALLFMLPPLTIVGAPLCLLSGIIVVKAL